MKKDLIYIVTLSFVLTSCYSYSTSIKLVADHDIDGPVTITQEGLKKTISKEYRSMPTHVKVKDSNLPVTISVTSPYYTFSSSKVGRKRISASTRFWNAYIWTCAGIGILGPTWLAWNDKYKPSTDVLYLSSKIEDNYEYYTNSTIEHFDKLVSDPPVLIVENILFSDLNKNEIIDANEDCSLKFRVYNKGKGVAHHCRVKVNIKGSTSGISCKGKELPVIQPDSWVDVILPIKSEKSTSNGSVQVDLKIEEPHGFSSDLSTVNILTQEFIVPKIQVSDYSVTSDNQSLLTTRVPFDLKILVQNTAQGDAENVTAEIELPENVILIGDEGNIKNLGNLNSGDTESLVYTIIVNDKYRDTNLPIGIKLKEKYGLYSEDETINLNLNQTLAKNNILIQGKKRVNRDIEIAQLEAKTKQSDVDIDIPVMHRKRDNTFAIIIANENYHNEENVVFAIKDGEVFSEYCKNVLGLKPEHVHLIKDATLSNIKSELNWLSKVVKAYNGDAEVLVYYAGHGIPDESEKSAYILPVDGIGTDINTGVSISELYSTLGRMSAKSIKVFLDACFSGSKRDGNMLVAARGVAIKIKETIPQGNVIVFSATKGDETAYPYIENGHGMFTYYLLKAIRDSKGDITMGKLYDYVSDQVIKQSIIINRKSQTPTITPSLQISDNWRNIKF